MAKLINRDALIKELNDRGVQYNADVNDCIYSMPIVKESDNLVNDLVNDCISRRDAIDAINKAFERVFEWDGSSPLGETVLANVPSAQPEITLEFALDYLHNIGWMQEHDRILTVSAQPERKRGQWEIYVISMIDGEGCKCSECGFEGAPYWDFCPNCGADMRGENE